ncbi:hypothetical protein VOI54_05375 [Tamlana sp. 2201CG12-4]|uniref:hypothetical protein n=1 Tax=Tamlana sp. 2201CG12-4 TaxID=3112582 RepID=UPI002DBB21BA|nr:hypothetical protein [Tamlana sp. 2201CG12-4]MEC3906438.1 hypothetical protein [Tamlana sp. 2201CG12-4]
MAHNLFLGMYSFRIKKRHSKDSEAIDNNTFLSESYPEEHNKFETGFVQDVVKVFDLGTFKNDKNTHGAILEENEFNKDTRTIDILINGGITGLKQYLIDENGDTSELSDKETIGLKFFARIWLPANSKSGYIFLQKYGSLSIKPIFDAILKKVLNENNYSLVGRKVSATTTKKRQKEFMRRSSLRDVILVSKRSVFDTNSVQARQATIKLSNIKYSSNNTIDKKEFKDALKKHGFSIGNRDYEIRATYVCDDDGYKQARTVVLDDSEETINIIPSILVPNNCIDIDNSPVFEEMKKLVDLEMAQVKKEAKL